MTLPLRLKFNMTNRIPQHLCISPTDHGQRLDQALAHQLPSFSRSQLSQWIKLGWIMLNNKKVLPRHKVLSGDILDFNVTEIEQHTAPIVYDAENIPLDIVYEDEDLIVINKPAGLIVHPGAGNSAHTLANALIYHAPGLSHVPRAGIVHRLDKDTSGLLVVAKNLVAQTSLVRQMQARTVSRTYLALVQGQVYQKDAIETYYGRHSRNRLKMSVCAQGKEAITHYKPLERYPGLTLIEVKLETGRTHQIRVHMAYLNLPIVGDPLYGTRIKLSPEFDDISKQLLLNFSRQALHAAQLSFVHPTSGEHLTFDCDLADDFQTLITDLSRYNE